MSLSYLGLGFFIVSAALAAEVVHHPAPKDPTFISAALYPTFKKALPLPPAPQDARQKKDEAELFDWQSKRQEKDCAEAKSEVMVSLESFYGPKSTLLTQTEVKKWTVFFEHVRNDADFFIQKLKKDFPRQRPFLYLTDLHPCVPREVTGAYPSGHAVLSKLFALILSDLYPERQTKLELRGQEIGQHRVLSGMHHPSDIEAGRELASLIYQELKKSPSFQKELAQVKDHK